MSPATSPAVPFTSLVDVSSTLAAPCRFLFKLESEQPSGSFKYRGMSKLVETSISAARARGASDIHVFCLSGGNAGLAAACASRSLGVPCTVVLPTTAKQSAMDKLAALGAQVLVHGAHWGEADAHLREVLIPGLPAATEAVYCHPFDDEVLWDGHGTMIDELAQQLQEQGIAPEAVKGVVCSCGGGGLYNGVVAGLRRNKGLTLVPVLVMETNQTPTLHSCVAADKLVTLASITTVSTSLAAPYVAAKTFDNYKLHPTTVALVDDMEAVEATVAYYDTYQELIEPACGATVAVATKRQDLLACFGELGPADVVVFIVCGGSTVSLDTLQAYRAMLEPQGQC